MPAREAHRVAVLVLDAEGGQFDEEELRHDGVSRFLLRDKGSVVVMGVHLISSC